MAKRKERLTNIVNRTNNGFEVSVPRLSNIDSIYDDIETAVNENNAADLASLLKKKFIYSNDASGSVWRPAVETLFYEHTSKFLSLVRLLSAEPVNADLFTAFEESLMGTELVPNELFAWNRSMHNKLQVDRAEIQLMSASLLNNESDPLAKTKSVALENLSNEMADILRVSNRPANDANDGTAASKLKALQLKLEIVEANQHAKPALAGHRGYERIAANMLSLMFAFIPNVVNYVLTGNFFFANKTASEKKVAHVVEDTGFDKPLNFTARLP